MSTKTELFDIKDENTPSKKNISYSQIMMYHMCPHKWYMTYVKNMATNEANIFLLFGSSMHTVIQLYLYVIYNGTIAEADKMDLDKMLLDELKKEFRRAKENSGVNPST